MNRINLKDKRLLIALTLVCLGLIVLTAATQKVVPQIQDKASYCVVPFQKSINRIGTSLRGFTDGFKDASELAKENRELKESVSELTAKNNEYMQSAEELERLRALYELDSEFPDYEKIAATVISKDPGNWYSSFVVNKGSSDGIERDMNVLGNGGLIGIVTETGKHWAKIRSVIDDESNVSAMVNGKSKLCTVSGSLKDMNSGQITFFGLQDPDDSVVEGDLLVTSNISEKFQPGLSIGYITEVYKDSNNMTKSGKLTPLSDFEEIREVLIIKSLKETGEDGEDE